MSVDAYPLRLLFLKRHTRTHMSLSTMTLNPFCRKYCVCLQRQSVKRSDFDYLKAQILKIRPPINITLPIHDRICNFIIFDGATGTKLFCIFRSLLMQNIPVNSPIAKIIIPI